MKSGSNILITGGSGLVGSALKKNLASEGHNIYSLVRRKPAQNEFYWNAKDQIDLPKNTKIDAVVHLSGENVAAGRWSKKIKQRIYESRILSTRLLVERLSALDTPPLTFICASAVGIYGDRKDTILLESTTEDPSANGFLVSVAKDWEQEAQKYTQNIANARVINARIGIVLSPDGGALEKMLPVFKMGMGGPLGDGKQYMSWISLTDLVSAFSFCLDNNSAEGAFNFCSPNPMTNAEFTKALGNFLNRPAIIPAPAFGLKLAMGQMAEELLLSSVRAIPKNLQSLGFEFQHTELDSAFKAEIN
ncbi:MAG: TIGR01777 family oxidoreductase [bacterium]|nr:TIGR01777 family oxidoreductase [bacterium]